MDLQTTKSTLAHGSNSDQSMLWSHRSLAGCMRMVEVYRGEALTQHDMDQVLVLDS